LRAALRAVGLYLLTAGPAYLVFRMLTPGEFYPRYPLTWEFVFPVALDLENPCLPLVGPDLARRLALGYLAVTASLLAVAWRQRRTSAIPFLLCPALLPACWLLGHTGVFGFHGLLYPLTLIGAVQLIGRGRRGLAGCVLALALIALHLPQTTASAKRYLGRSIPNYPVVVGRGDCEAVREIVGSDDVDVYLGDVCDNHLVLAELAAHGTRVRLRTPTWERSLINWAAAAGASRPSYPSARSRYSLVESGAYAPPGSVRFRGKRLMLCEDADRITFRGFHEWEVIAWDEARRPGFWLRRSPVAVEIYNGTGRPASVAFLAEVRRPLEEPRTLGYQFVDQAGEVAIYRSASEVRLPLAVPAGLSRLELSVPRASSDDKLLLWLTNLRLEEDPSLVNRRP
jgi:hypothetical protein